MKTRFDQFLLSRYFTFISIFLVVFCIISVLVLNSSHPLYWGSFIMGIILFILQRYRKKLGKQ